jgi:hypothetical protein
VRIGHYGEAELLLESAHESLLRERGEDHRYTMQARRALTRLEAAEFTPSSPRTGR